MVLRKVLRLDLLTKFIVASSFLLGIGKLFVIYNVLNVHLNVIIVVDLSKDEIRF